MSNKTTIVVVLALVVILGFAWWSLSDRGGEAESPADSGSAQLPESLTVNRYFEKGSHTIEGTITLPTPCHTLAHEVQVAESMPEQVTIKFTTKPGEGVCTQILADKFFRVTFGASEQAVITATLDGKPVTLIYSETKTGITK